MGNTISREGVPYSIRVSIVQELPVPYAYLKVLSSEMDTAEIRLIR